MKTVRVTLKGGVIQDVSCPKGVRVIVHDYDTDEIDEKDLTKDSEGNPCIETIWE
jgi:hypothetical protein